MSDAPLTSNAHRRIVFYWNGQVADFGVQFYLQEDLTIGISSNYGPLIGDKGGNGLLDMAGAIAGKAMGLDRALFSSQNKWFGFQKWEGSEPMSLQFTLNLHVGMPDSNGVPDWDAETAVFNPMKKLARAFLPKELPGGMLQPPGSTAVDVMYRAAGDMGTGLADFIGDKFGGGDGVVSELANKAAGALLSGATYLDSKVNHWSIRIGSRIFIPWIVVRRCEPTIGSEFDQSGYPISAKISMEVTSAQGATVEELGNWG